LSASISITSRTPSMNSTNTVLRESVIGLITSLELHTHSYIHVSNVSLNASVQSLNSPTTDNQPTNQPTNQTDWPTDQPDQTNRSTDWPTNSAIIQSINQSISHSINQSINQSIMMTLYSAKCGQQIRGRRWYKTRQFVHVHCTAQFCSYPARSAINCDNDDADEVRNLLMWNLRIINIRNSKINVYYKTSVNLYHTLMCTHMCSVCYSARKSYNSLIVNSQTEPVYQSTTHSRIV